MDRNWTDVVLHILGGIVALALVAACALGNAVAAGWVGM